MGGGALALVTVLAAAAPGPVSAAGRVHTSLLASHPAVGDTLPAGALTIELRFSGPVDASLADVVLAVGNSRPVPLTVRADSTDARRLFAEAPVVGPGAYRIGWRVVSADGHPVEGDIPFYVAGEEGNVPSHLDHPPPVPEIAGTPADATVPAGTRALAGFVLMALAGLLGFVALNGAGDGPRPRTVVLVLGLLAPVLLAVHGIAWTAYVTGDPGAIGQALATTPGRIETVRFGLALLTLWAIAIVRRPGLAAGFAFAAVAAGAALGHSLALRPVLSIPVKAIHLIAVSVWIGGVLHLLFAARQGSLSIASARRVSAAALLAVVVVLVTGAAQTALFLTGWTDLLTTGYGRLVALKIAGLGVLIGFGARHRRIHLPRLDGGTHARGFQRTLTLEILVMAAIVLLAGALAYTPPPEAIP